MTHPFFDWCMCDVCLKIKDQIDEITETESENGIS